MRRIIGLLVLTVSVVATGCGSAQIAGSDQAATANQLSTAAPAGSQAASDPASTAPNNPQAPGQNTYQCRIQVTLASPDKQSSATGTTRISFAHHTARTVVDGTSASWTISGFQVLLSSQGQVVRWDAGNAKQKPYAPTPFSIVAYDMPVFFADYLSNRRAISDVERSPSGSGSQAAFRVDIDRLWHQANPLLKHHLAVLSVVSPAAAENGLEVRVQYDTAGRANGVTVTLPSEKPGVIQTTTLTDCSAPLPLPHVT